MRFSVGASFAASAAVALVASCGGTEPSARSTARDSQPLVSASAPEAAARTAAPTRIAPAGSPAYIVTRSAAAPIVAVSSDSADVRPEFQPVFEKIDGLRQEVARGEVIVRFRGEAGSRAAASALASIGARLDALAEGRYHLVRLPEGMPLKPALDALRRDPAVLSAEPNHICRGSAADWHFQAIGLARGTSLLPKSSTAGPIVAVVDSGIAYESRCVLLKCYQKASSLSGTVFVPGWDFVGNDSHPNDEHGHGTHVATTIAGVGYVNSTLGNYTAPAPGARLMPVRVLDAGNSGSEYWLASGIRWAVDHGAQVINLSLNFARVFVPGGALRDAVDYARDRGVAMVGAAGNDAGPTVLFPAAFPDVISVGAVRPEGTSGYSHAPYSTYGATLDLVAPGGDLTRDSNGDGLKDGVLGQSFSPGSPGSVGWWYFSGTSQAAPHVTATVAAARAAGASTASIQRALFETAADLGAPGYDALYGSGLLNAPAAVARAAQVGPAQPVLADAVAALLADRGAAAAVRVIRGDGTPVPGARVTVQWKGGASALQQAVTDAAGIARFRAPPSSVVPRLFLAQVVRVEWTGGPTEPYAFASDGSGLADSTADGSGLADSTADGSGLADSTADGSSTHTYDGNSREASDAFFGGAALLPGYSLRSVDSLGVFAPGAAALDEDAYAQLNVAAPDRHALNAGYFGGTIYLYGPGQSTPLGFGAGDSPLFWSLVQVVEALLGAVTGLLGGLLP